MVVAVVVVLVVVAVVVEVVVAVVSLRRAYCFVQACKERDFTIVNSSCYTY